jgi:hypothetical protein
MGSLACLVNLRFGMDFPPCFIRQGRHTSLLSPVFTKNLPPYFSAGVSVMNPVTKRPLSISNNPFIRTQIVRPNIWPIELDAVCNLPQ